MATFTRQPFAELGSSRLQALQSAKNKQKAASPTLVAPWKPSPTPSTGKRQRAPEIFEDHDSENIDPSRFGTPTKKHKTFNEAGFVKPAVPSLFPEPSRPKSNPTTTPTVSSSRKILSSPKTAKSTPITTSRGSPKNKRLHAVSKRRVSSSPFRRVDPPSFAPSSNTRTLPFSIDAALSGSIPTYTPKPKPVAMTAAAVPESVTTPAEEIMPKTWFFAIHEDTPEQEAANLMEHSASVLDISSDEDAESKKRNEELSRGKENVPPPEWVGAQQTRLTQTSEAVAHVDESTNHSRLRPVVQDAMDEDRKPLGDLPPCDFYAAGCDASSYVTVDMGIERPSRLSRECDFSITAHEDAAVAEATTTCEPSVTPQKTTTAVSIDDKTVAATPAPEANTHTNTDAPSPAHKALTTT